CNYEVTRAAAPDFIVRKFEGKYLKESDAGAIIELGKKMDSVLIGPGLGEHEESISTVVRILNELHIPTVLDASGMLALKEIKKFPLQQPVVVTPHNNEFQHLVDRDVLVKEDDPKSVILLRSLSMDLHINVLLKSAVDFVSSDEGLVEKNLTGNAGMTVGGSGDVLAGVVASFMAQGLEGFDAARCAAFVVGRAGDLLFKEKGVCYTASEIAEMVGVAVNKL
ncbi:NAD(P)H-hydrate dehydratase, partial [Patescibacteria group bacterium]|nr:NAD(P)H-hydrate dehydratase [Patescibacteria group bacterium]